MKRGAPPPATRARLNPRRLPALRRAAPLPPPHLVLVPPAAAAGRRRRSAPPLLLPLAAARFVMTSNRRDRRKSLLAAGELENELLSRFRSDDRERPQDTGTPKSAREPDDRARSRTGVRSSSRGATAKGRGLSSEGLGRAAAGPRQRTRRRPASLPPRPMRRPRSAVRAAWRSHRDSLLALLSRSGEEEWGAPTVLRKTVGGGRVDLGRLTGGCHGRPCG